MASPFDCYRDRRTLFGSDVASYDLGRPGYPERVYEFLRERCRLGPGAHVLEIGPGTGQATKRLLAFGVSVTAVELSVELADCLRAKIVNRELDIKVGAFEDIELPNASFDVVVAATSFHWLAAQSSLQRCADLLCDGGRLAIWWTVFGDPGRPDPFHDALVPILRELAPALLDVPSAGNPATDVPAYALDVEARIAEIEATSRFGPVDYEAVAWTGRHRPEQIRALFASFSPWLALEPTQRTAVLDALERLATEDFAGMVERPYLTPIYVTRKIR